MVWTILAHLVTTLLDWMSIGRFSSGEKEWEILLMRQQLTIMQRGLDKSVRPERVEKLTLAVLAAKLKSVLQRPTTRPGDSISLFQPETVLKGIANWCHKSGANGEAIQVAGRARGLNLKHSSCARRHHY